MECREFFRLRKGCCICHCQQGAEESASTVLVVPGDTDSRRDTGDVEGRLGIRQVELVLTPPHEVDLGSTRIGFDGKLLR